MKKIINILVLLLLVFNSSMLASSFAFGYKNGSTETRKTLSSGLEVVSGGGSYSIRFKRIKPIPTLLELNAPSIQMGCGGLSMHGMYGELINLDELMDTLEQAGKSFAWGVLLGIVSSLPTIGDVFAKLNAFVKEIQKMLANACALGTSLGKEIGNKYVRTALDDTFPSLKGKDAFSEYVDTAQEDSGDLTSVLMKFIKGDMGATDEDKQEIATDLVLSAMPGSDSIVVSFLNSMYNISGSTYQLHKKNFIADLDGTIYDSFPFAGSEDNDVIIYDPKKFPLTMTGMDPDLYKFNSDMFMLVYNFIITSDKVIDVDLVISHIKKISTDLNDITNAASISDENLTTKTQEIEKMTKKIAELKEGANAGSTPLSTSYRPEMPHVYYTADGNAEVMPSLLDFIFEDSSEKITFQIPLIQLLYLKKFDAAFLIAIPEHTTADPSTTWGTRLNSYSDLETKAKAQVECLVLDDNTTTSVNVTKGDGSVVTISCNTLPPVILPQARRLLRIYQQSDDATRLKLKNIVQARNTQYMLMAVRNGIKKSVNAIEANNKKVNGSSDGSAVMNLRSLQGKVSMNIEANMKELHTFIEELDKKIIKYVNIKFLNNTLFEEQYINKIDMQNKQRPMSDILY